MALSRVIAHVRDTPSALGYKQREVKAKTGMVNERPHPLLISPRVLKYSAGMLGAIKHLPFELETALTKLESSVHR